MLSLKYLLLSILVMTSLSFIQCSSDAEVNCHQCIRLIHSNEKYPIHHLDWSKSKKELRKEMDILYGTQLADSCDFINFHLPFDYCGSEILLKFETDFRTNGLKCPTWCGIRERCRISLNEDTEILFENSLSHIDSLKSSIDDYLTNIGSNTDYYPIRYEDNIFNLSWTKRTGSELMTSTITKILNGHIHYLKKKISPKKLSNLDEKEIHFLLKKYPLRIELDIQESEIIKFN